MIIGKTSSDRRMILTEVDTDFALYYESGSSVPFNFMLILDLNNKSSAADFKRSIDSWMNIVPKNPAYVANWVVGNHDNHRAASRFGEKRADQLSMLATVLPVRRERDLQRRRDRHARQEFYVCGSRGSRRMHSWTQ